MEGRKCVFSAGVMVTTDGRSLKTSFESPLDEESVFELEAKLKNLDGAGQSKERKKDQKRSSKTVPVFIERDNADGRGIKFKTGFPEGLTGRLDPEEFNVFITKINEMYRKAEGNTWKNDVRRFLSSLAIVKMFIDSPGQKAEKTMKLYLRILNYLFKEDGLCFHYPDLTSGHMQIDVREDDDFNDEPPL